MSTSLKDFEDAQHIADTLLFDKDHAQDKTILYVEGDDDEFVYKQFICEQQCEIIVQDGDCRLVNAIKMHNQENRSGYVAIKDNHFDVLLEHPVPKNILTTDGHDLEVMILRSKALENVIDVRLRGEDKEQQERVIDFKSALRDRLFRLGSIIGYLRFKSCINSWGITIVVGRFLQHLTTDCELAFRVAVKEFESCFSEVDTSQLDSEEFEKLYSRHPQHLCRGHDMVFIFSQIFKRMTKLYLKQEYNPGNDLAERLLLTFNETHFRATQLYQQILDWQSYCTSRRILKSDLCPSTS